MCVCVCICCPCNCSRSPCTIDTYRPLQKLAEQLIYSLWYISINYQLYIPAIMIFTVAPYRVGSQLRSRKMLYEERSSVRAWRRSETCYGDLTCSLNYMDRDLLRALFDGNDSSKQSISIWDKILKKNNFKKLKRIIYHCIQNINKYLIKYLIKK